MFFVVARFAKRLAVLIIPKNVSVLSCLTPTANGVLLNESRQMYLVVGL